jgi:hypothetical protein
MPTPKGTEEAPKLPKLSKAEKKKLFEAAEKEQGSVDRARAALEDASEKRSKAVQAIFEKCGAGPFNFKGRVLTITKRKRKDSDELTYYFKSPSKNEIEDI